MSGVLQDQDSTGRSSNFLAALTDSDRRQLYSDDVDFTADARNSSPLPLFECQSETVVAEATGMLDAGDAPGHPAVSSLATSPRSEQSPKGGARSGSGAKSQKMQDDELSLDASDSDGEDGADESANRQAFLDSFRQRFAKGQGLPEEPTAASSVFSGTLSDPPTASSNPSLLQTVTQNALNVSSADLHEQQTGSVTSSTGNSRSTSPSPSSRVARKNKYRAIDSIDSALGHDRTSGEEESSSPYVTEKDKRTGPGLDPTARINKIQELAARARQRGIQSQADDEEGISSSSEVDIEEEDSSLSNAIAKAKRESAQRTKKSLTSNLSRAGKSLDLETDNDSSDSDPEPSRRPPVKAPRALGKKEMEKMNQMRARVEREAKARNARQARETRPREVFGIKDLLSNVASAESRSDLNNGTGTRVKKAPSTNSDPIESSESSDDELGDLLPSKEATHKPFFAKMKEKMAISWNAVEAGTDQLTKEERADILQQKKLGALSAAKNVDLSMLGTDEDNDVEFYFVESEQRADGQSRTHADQGVVARKQARMGIDRSRSSSGNDDTLMLASGGDETIVTDSQIKRSSAAMQRQPMDLDKTKQAERIAKPLQSARGNFSKPARLTQKEFTAMIDAKIRQQNANDRRKREAARGASSQPNAAPPLEEESNVKDSISEILQRLQEGAAEKPCSDSEDGGNDEAEDSDYDPHAATNAEEVDFGSASEEEADSSSEEEEGRLPDTGSQAGSDDHADDDELLQDKSVTTVPSRRARVIVDEEEDKDTQEAREAMGEEGKEAAAQVLQTEQSVPLINTDDERGFSQFFAETQVPGKADYSPVSGEAPRDALGEFFLEGTQSAGPSRAASFNVLPRSDDIGRFTQLFEQGTQEADDDRIRMPPPITSARTSSLLASGIDAFAALRNKEQAAGGHIGDVAVDLPSLEGAFNEQEMEDIIALESEAIRADEEDRLKRMEKQRRGSNAAYLNKEGFFTQTRPDDMSFMESQTQSQSFPFDRSEDDDEDAENIQGDTRDAQVLEMASTNSPEQPRLKRLRRAVEVEEESDHEHEDEHDAEADRRRRNFIQDDAHTLLKESEILSQAPESAFDRLRAGQNALDAPRRKKLPVHRFLEGEAEESDEEDMAHDRHRKQNDRGGLGGVFSDEEKSTDEDSDDEDDGGEDVEGLIDEEREDDEAEKDTLARERYLRDIDADDQAAQALHEKAIRGGFRSRRRGRNEDGTIGDFLEDDFEDDWLEKKAKNPFGVVAKKRKLEGKDGLDALAENEESRAFVLQYRKGHNRDEMIGKYDFLQVVEDDERTMHELYGIGERLDGTSQSNGVFDHNEGSDESDAEEQQRIMTRKDLQQEIMAIRRRQRRQRKGLLDEEDIEAEEEHRRAQAEQSREAQLQRLINSRLMPDCSDDEEFGEDPQVPNHQLPNDYHQIGVQDRSGQKHFDAEDDDEEIMSAEIKGIGARRAVTDRERSRLEKLAKDYENEPNWDDAHLARTKRSRAAGSTNVSALTSKPAQNGVLQNQFQNASSRSRPVILSKLRGVMSRQSQFSSTSLQEGNS